MLFTSPLALLPAVHLMNRILPAGAMFIIGTFGMVESPLPSTESSSSAMFQSSDSSRFPTSKLLNRLPFQRIGTPFLL